MRRFENKVVVVTGAASGIGRDAAIRLASEGAQIIGLDVSEAGLQETAELLQAESCPTAEMLCCDISSEASVTEVVASIVARYQRIDVLVNMAGVLKFSNAHQLDLADWQRIIDINLTGTFLLCKTLLPHLIASKGNIVNASSTAALAGLPWGVAYAASKGGVLAMTRSIAVEYAKRGVRANCICPGEVQTNMAAQVTFPEDADFDLINRIVSLTGSKGPEVVSGVIAMLASEDGCHITGEEIRIDGGMQA